MRIGVAPLLIILLANEEEDRIESPVLSDALGLKDRRARRIMPQRVEKPLFGCVYAFCGWAPSWLNTGTVSG